ncbi:glycosyl hydrolase family 5 [Flavobacterium arcticum]|uniref:Glycosyl hydrolase family 5 n=1 Tax=Flavobacterium arcticum TaxID=1784713 RepID=A0A345H8G4_9FLAO|nr:glycoside hydrolase family 2 TIM barrel-domain containing protein [Flavobacterium arcticum]AXG72874.1 glycosyl hydrolase family 5 [Flavobacterium arcticum]KAF2510462.1 cellulase family glycosylhydrolase [Flavobacterium arcticum]
MQVNNKNIYKILLLASFVGINILLLFGLSNILGYLNTGAERTSMLHLEKETVNTYLPKVKWTSLENPGRKMEQQTLSEIEKDYLFAWHIRNNAFKTNSKEGIADFYTDSSRVNLYKIIDHNTKQNTTIESTTIAHNPKLEFYSADGQLVVFTDKNVVEYQNIFQEKKLISSIKDTATYKVLMLLEDGFWRIRHIKRIDKETVTDNAAIAKPIYTVSGKKILNNNNEFTIKGINYYPKNSPWDMYGEKFNTDTIAQDFDIIKNAGLNTIRIFVPYEAFGKADIIPEKIEKLEKVLDLAEEQQLAVVVTLFDFYGDYSIESWTLTHRHAEKIITTFKDHKAILAWDIKNEPDLDFESRGQNNVLAWLKNIIPLVKQWDANHLVTIGWSNTDDAIRLNDLVDFVSYHYYQDIKYFSDKQDVLQDATKKPVILQEFGVSSYNGFWNWFGKDEDDQAEFHKKMQAIFKEKQLAFISWTLYDFGSVPTAVVGKKPWVRNKQKEFGFIDVKGNKKPSYLHITY